MQPMYYLGLDVHKRKISYSVKDASGVIHSEGSIPATRFDLDCWMRTLPHPWSAAIEATMFTGWIYDHPKPHAAALKVAHPLMLRATIQIYLMVHASRLHFFGEGRNVFERDEWVQRSVADDHLGLHSAL